MSTPKTLLIGPPNNLAVNVVYALPARACKLFTNVTTGMQVSVNHTTGFVDLLTDDTAGTDVGPGFIRCTAASPVVYVKAL